MMKSILFTSFVLLCLSSHTLENQGFNFNQHNPTHLKFDFGPGKIAEGYKAVLPEDAYHPAKGYGIVSDEPVFGKNREGEGPLEQDLIWSESPFYFEADLPEGNYNVSITFGDMEAKTITTVKAESRRLMIEKVVTQPGEFITKTFSVNIRRPSINQSDSILLKPRELHYLNWDNKLSLEFNNARPAVNAIEITTQTDPVVVFLAGNSTVVDQEKEPWAAWGQMVPAFFTPEVVVANFAESGEALRSFRAERRLKKILSLMTRGDYLFIEFAHNDQKPGAAYAAPFTTYKEELKHFINAARNKGGKPVLVTSMHRRRFDENGKIVNTLEGYPEAMRQTAKEENVPLIDLNEMSKQLYQALGIKGSKRAFVHYPAHTYPGQDEALADDTHFNNYGAYQLARCVVKGIKSNVPELAQHLKNGIRKFEPSEPDAMSTFDLPASPFITKVKPDGN